MTANRAINKVARNYKYIETKRLHSVTAIEARFTKEQKYTWRHDSFAAIHFVTLQRSCIRTRHF